VVLSTQWGLLWDLHWSWFHPWQGYPFYPNGRTVFVKVPSLKILNFGAVGYTKQTCSENPKDGEWKVTCIYCLGVLVCDPRQNRWARSPPTGSNQIAAYLKKSGINLWQLSLVHFFYDGLHLCWHTMTNLSI
jgi:hypothetical protein